MRICSLLPSATEIVYALGLGDSLVGITHECDYPPEAARLPAVTSSAIDHTNATGREIHEHVADALRNVTSIYRLDQELLERLDPDLVLTQELCEVCAVSYDEVQRAVRLLPGQRKVLSLEPMTLEGIWDTIRSVGQTAGVEEQAQRIADELAARVAVVEAAVQDVAHRPRVLAMEWLDPVFIGGHWVPEMIRLAGGTDGLGVEGRPSTQVTWGEIAAYDPEVIVLMPCGYHLDENVEEFARTSLPSEWLGLTAVKRGQVYAVDGSAYFNRPGPRAADGLEILAEILHPELYPRTTPTEAWRKLDVLS
ncbi:MAG: cobalamin-binding protein [Chloroflexi bacterium]|nr:cobalamin-binding protein [Chloroflexota bacterium]